ncbi:isoprenylcysteine carboxylmethyltransferase family protein [Sulfurimonas sp. SAG-AH-194-C20]|nr:isoprenylcysteine carboxylmethyltransferase family protein [Sulfurimonas sp. SAG-AH-194-C20]MDF1878638.1 isoprenylcysteine carboxylmethyltransferase family protein [Sulfurimonas sp. SAG-AH-194-C20]
MQKFKGYSLVFSQFFLILIMLLPLGTEPQNLLLALIIIIFGGGVGILALYCNRFFNIRPDIKEDASLVTTGVYSYIRHPMYTAVLTMMFGVTLLYPVTYVFICYALLVLTLFTKLFYEESLWKAQSSEYEDYMRGTKRLVPFIF